MGEGARAPDDLTWFGLAELPCGRQHPFGCAECERGGESTETSGRCTIGEVSIDRSRLNCGTACVLAGCRGVWRERERMRREREERDA